MSGAIRVEHIRDGSSRSEQTELRGVIRLEQSGVKASGEKMRKIGAEQENNGEIENSGVKRENQSVVRRSERRVRKLVLSRSEQVV